MDKKDKKENKQSKENALGLTGGEYVEMNLNSDEFDKINKSLESANSKGKPFSVTVKSNRSNKDHGSSQK